ncbi:hypothetical protein BDV30DRAFT_26132 [Aspergillus minisclerotigenes]|uniref:Uncharacterized protein n=1 Tax=Aspergillus minisclerotigenes TaxID=656917 RepID=A0A5N6JD81_9EURO|nr:hypothetical protein BDV30DRAFT_26132 [Aspergillus minisclerotigenes]
MPRMTIESEILKKRLRVDDCQRKPDGRRNAKNLAAWMLVPFSLRPQLNPCQSRGRAHHLQPLHKTRPHSFLQVLCLLSPLFPPEMPRECRPEPRKATKA